MEMNAYKRELLLSYIRGCDQIVFRKNGTYYVLFIQTGPATVAIRLF